MPTAKPKKRRYTWRSRVKRALGKLGPAPTLAEIYDAIPRGARLSNWKATTRRTLQELRAQGVVGFQAGSGVRGRRGKRGAYVIAGRDVEKILAELVSILEFGFSVEEARVETLLQPLGGFPANEFEFSFGEDEETNTRILTSAVRHLNRHYPRKTTAVSIRVETINEKTGVVDEEWMTLGRWAPSPAVAADQLDHEFFRYSTEKVRYRVMENLRGLSIMVRI